MTCRPLGGRGIGARSIRGGRSITRPETDLIWPVAVLPAWVGTGNLFTAPTDLSNVAWTRSNLATHATAPGYAGETASVLAEASDTAVIHEITQSVSVTSGLTYILRALVKQGSGTRMIQNRVPSNRFGVTATATFDLMSGAIFNESNTPSAAVTNLGYGNFVVSITKAATSTGAAVIGFRMHNGTSVTYDGDGASLIIVTALGLHVVP